MRRRLVCGNWKMNPPTIAEAVTLARAVASLRSDDVELAVAPPAVALAAVAEALRGSGVHVYAQDAHWEESGAFTGATAASMLRGVAGGAIVGHSEVRRDQGDDDARVAAKLARVLAAGLAAILCVGETEAQFAAGETEAVVARQVALDLARAPRGRGPGVGQGPRGAQLAIAYEPIWAIGTGRPATGAHAAAAARVVRAALRKAGWDDEATLVLYGGSVSAAGVAEFAGAEGIDGALVGGASLEARGFGAIVEAFAGAA